MDTFASGVRSIVSVLRPRGDGWREIDFPVKRFTLGHPARAFMHDRHSLAVISAVEVAADKDGVDRGPEYHISISKQIGGAPQRATSDEAKWVLDQFGLDGAEEDNHVPYGKVRNFWRTVAAPLIGLECACKADEPAVTEDKGDFVWRP